MTDRLRESFKRTMSVKPQAAAPSEEASVSVARLDSSGDLPLVVRAAVEGVDLLAWAERNSGHIEKLLAGSGALLFRGFELSEIGDFRRFVRALSSQLVDYRERSTPRSEIEDRIYTSTEYPADQHIPLHNEMSYAHAWPLKIWFFCAQKAETGGETPLADSRRVFAEIPPQIRERFMTKGLLYVRNFGTGLSLPWQEVFQTTERSAVEQYCRDTGMSCEWLADGRLRTAVKRPAVARHRRTNELVWFNQAHLHHPSSLDAQTRESLLAHGGEDTFPFNTYYGDGSAIADSELDGVRAAYDRVAVSFPWQRGDILMLDNMMVAHGRRPYAGPRKIMVAMAELYDGRSE